MDIATIALAFEGIKAAVGGVAGWRSGKATREELEDLGVRYWGCLLFEMRRNFTQLRAHVQNGADEDGLLLLDFAFADALLPELARLTPAPAPLNEASGIVGMMRHMATLGSLDIATRATPRSLGQIRTIDVRATWKMLARELLEHCTSSFNALRAAVVDRGRDVFGPEWERVESAIVPPEFEWEPT